jgi:hypothetical protein
MDDLRELFWDVLNKTPNLIKAVSISVAYADSRHLATKASGAGTEAVNV